MANLDYNQATTITNTIKDFSLNSARIDESNNNDETYWYFSDFPKNLAYYKETPMVKQSVDSLAMWTAGRGYETDNYTRAVLRRIKGWGEDSFDSIMMGLIVIKKVNGDAFAEIIEDEETNILTNLKPLNPLNVRIVVDKKGIIKRYDVWSGQDWKPLKKNKMLHLSNIRICGEIHGQSAIPSCKWSIDAKEEAQRDWRRYLHNSTIRIIEVDTEDVTQINQIKTQYAEGIKNGQVMILPKNNTEIKDFTAMNVATFLEWIRYLDSSIMQSLGVPKSILGGTDSTSEAASKVSYMTFDQVWATEARLLEQDIWNQLRLEITFNSPTSLKDDMINSEAANTGQIGFQPNEMTTQVGRTE